MTNDKEHPALLAYALLLFLLISIVSYLLLADWQSAHKTSGQSAGLETPSYQNLFSRE